MDPTAAVPPVLVLPLLLVVLVVGGLLGALAVRLRLSGELARSRLAQARAEGERDLALSTADHASLTDRRSGELGAALAPLADTLERVRGRVERLDTERWVQLGTLAEQVRAVQEVGTRLQAETTTLAGALRSPTARGAWGEVQLERVVEAAGMLRHVDFQAQQSSRGSDGRRHRPDLVVRLPGDRVVVVDAKAPLVLQPVAGASAAEHGAAQAKAIRAHVTALSAKAYWEGFARAPEFVVCFLPAESVLAAALAADPDLLDDAMRAHVVPATPTTLLALLRTVALSWREHSVHANAMEVLALGRELHQRLGVVAKHADGVGRGLGRAVEDYNRMVASMETRLLVTARRMTELDLAAADVAAPAAVESLPRPVSAPEAGPPLEPPDQAAQDRPGSLRSA